MAFLDKILFKVLPPIDERYPYYGSERLYRLPVKLGYRKQPLTESELNQIPHPFP